MAKENQMVRIYNRSNVRTFTHFEKGPKGEQIKWSASPSAMSDVPKHVADLWLSSYKDFIIEAGAAQAEIGGIQAQLQAKNTELEAANKRIVELEAQIKAKNSKGEI